MDEDTEYLKLPLEERMVHKLWKARVSGYEDAKKLFGQVSQEPRCFFTCFYKLVLIFFHALSLKSSS